MEGRGLYSLPVYVPTYYVPPLYAAAGKDVGSITDTDSESSR